MQEGSEDREQPFPLVFSSFISQDTEEQILTSHCVRLDDKVVPVPNALCVYVLLPRDFQFTALEAGWAPWWLRSGRHG